MAWTWGKFVSSAMDNRAGAAASDLSSLMTFVKSGLCVFEESIPVMRAGIPADRRVVETCSKMHFRVPWLSLDHINFRCNEAYLIVVLQYVSFKLN